MKNIPRSAPKILKNNPFTRRRICHHDENNCASCLHSHSIIIIILVDAACRARTVYDDGDQEGEGQQ
jgi:hypothetical protein